MIYTLAVSLALALASTAALAADPTYPVVTSTGETVQATGPALTDAYMGYVNSTFNGIYKNEDGSTSIVRPAVMVGGVEHMAAAINGGNIDYVTGVCKIKGYSRAISFELDLWAVAPVALVNMYGNIAQVYESRQPYVVAFRSVICR